ncbi:MAG: hypothetical protein GX119_06560 [Syntrophomonadaceae bacterium]|jgi:hypothetical protein|nr:hypothetical protein [Syntrophomonadaceae bacterium]
MITAIKNTDLLIEGVLDYGLTYIGEYLEKILQHSIIIADHHGKIFFPEKRSPALIDSLFLDIPVAMGKNEYYHNEGEENSLYYRIAVNGRNAYVIVKNLKKSKLSQVLAILKESRLAVKCYFSKMNHGSALFKKKLTEYLFTSNRANLMDILQLSDTELEVERPCFLVLLQTEAQQITEDLELICLYGNEYWLRNNLKPISLYHQDQLAFIIPVNPALDPSGDLNMDLTAFKDTLEKRFQINTVLGAGRVYPLIDMEKSLNEARIAMILNGLMGSSNVVQNFSELGIYQPIFSQDIQQITEYCNQKLGRLIKHDNKNDGELLPTLRRLLDTCVNIKATADSLNIHVNTLYYRINRIEQILEIDLSKMATRVELFTAIKVWDTLLILNGDNQAWSRDQNPNMALQA